ncbi:hypothetical protein PVK06_043072 [Gossypium arboreum]|uniref:Uncharacterized protein n=1 Tax=Gossypium arboreum TaxID=29729 RepID=A0ABR0MN01_GOSAR|nr:hypothetical protein PVK06_043072 [Gossypium arboreum]
MVVPSEFLYFCLKLRQFEGEEIKKRSSRKNDESKFHKRTPIMEDVEDDHSDCNDAHSGQEDVSSDSNDEVNFDMILSQLKRKRNHMSLYRQQTWGGETFQGDLVPKPQRF